MEFKTEAASAPREKTRHGVSKGATKITPTDLTLAIGDENAYYDQLVPFNDILEIEIRLKEEAQA